MRIYEIASPEDQLELLKIIISNTWDAVEKQALQQRYQQAVAKSQADIRPKKVKKKSNKRPTGSIKIPPIPVAKSPAKSKSNGIPNNLAPQVKKGSFNSVKAPLQQTSTSPQSAPPRPSQGVAPSPNRIQPIQPYKPVGTYASTPPPNNIQGKAPTPPTTYPPSVNRPPSSLDNANDKINRNIGVKSRYLGKKVAVSKR